MHSEVLNLDAAHITLTKCVMGSVPYVSLTLKQNELFPIAQRMANFAIFKVRVNFCSFFRKIMLYIRMKGFKKRQALRLLLSTYSQLVLLIFRRTQPQRHTRALLKKPFRSFVFIHIRMPKVSLRSDNYKNVFHGQHISSHNTKSPNEHRASGHTNSSRNMSRKVTTYPVSKV